MLKEVDNKLEEPNFQLRRVNPVVQVSRDSQIEK